MKGEINLTTNNSFSPELNISLQSYRDDYDNKLSTLEYGDILAVNMPNRIGKTFTTLKHYEMEPCKVLYLSDRHDQISEIDNGEKYVHWYGLNKLCEKKDDKFIGSLIAQGLRANVICRYCDKKTCNYKKQFDIPDNVIVIAPKEFLQTQRVKQPWDVIIFDENMEKAKKIKSTYPSIPEEVFTKYNVDYQYYQEIGNFIETLPTDVSTIKLTFIGNTFNQDLINIINQIKTQDKLIEENEKDLIAFLNNIQETIQWISYAQKHGLMEHFYKPYLHYAFDLRKEYKSKIIILNTSLERWIYDKITDRYEYDLPEPEFYSAHFNNYDSLLLNYNHNKRSCNKGAITQKRSIFKSKKRGSIFGGNYGSEILEMVQRSISYANNHGLKVGIISFKDLKDELEEKFQGKTHIISYFGGHQGSNKFDDVDVLIIIGTYHINPSGLYQIHYKITGEYLKDNPANMRANKKTINGTQLYLTDNEDFNKVKLYKLKEEHGQAIFRSGAHVKPDKIVINFGFVPEGTEKVLKYKEFKNKEQLMGHLSRINMRLKK